MELEAHKAALDAACELPVVVEVRVEPEERHEGAWVLLVGVPDDVVRTGVVVAGVRIVQGEYNALLHPCGLHALSHTVSGHRTAVDVGPDVSVRVEDLYTSRDLRLYPGPDGGHSPARERLDVVLHLQSARRSKPNDREMVTGGIGRCSRGAHTASRAAPRWSRQPRTLSSEVEAQPV